MCSVPAVSDYYMNTYPNRQMLNHLSGLGAPQVTQVIQSMDPEVKDMLRRAIELLDRVDKKLGDIDCMDAEKVAFLNALTPNEL